jgi:hypothetical protein
VRRADYIREVTELRRRNRGRELCGTFNPLIIEDLFLKQCQPWRALAGDLQERVIADARTLMESILEETAAAETLAAIREVIEDGIRRVTKCVAEKADEVLGHLSGIPQTYNHYLTDTVQKIQQDRQVAKLKASLSRRFGDADSSVLVRLSPSSILEIMTDNLVINMEEYASSTAIDFSEAYFKVRSDNKLTACMGERR